jgi:hypothetical protein
MPSRTPVFSVFLLLFASAVCDAQTATCTNWKFFNLPSPWVGTYPHAINRWGTVVGDTQSSDGSTVLGFIRYSNGAIKTYSFPNSSETRLTKRNAPGVTVGFWGPTDYHGIVLSGSSVATVNYPGAEDTVLLGINYWGTMVGIFSSTTFYTPYDGFKLKNGVFTTLHYPGSASTNPTSISDKGVIAGWYQNGGYHKYHGFTLANGVYKTFDHPKAVYGTFLNDINGSGTMVGKYVDGSFQYHGFIYINGVFKNVIGLNVQISSVEGINGYGYVTGSSSAGGFTAHCQ